MSLQGFRTPLEARVSREFVSGYRVLPRGGACQGIALCEGGTGVARPDAGRSGFLGPSVAGEGRRRDLLAPTAAVGAVAFAEAFRTSWCTPLSGTSQQEVGGRRRPPTLVRSSTNSRTDAPTPPAPHFTNTVAQPSPVSPPTLF